MKDFELTSPPRRKPYRMVDPSPARVLVVYGSEGGNARRGILKCVRHWAKQCDGSYRISESDVRSLRSVLRLRPAPGRAFCPARCPPARRRSRAAGGVCLLHWLRPRGLTRARVHPRLHPPVDPTADRVGQRCEDEPAAASQGVRRSDCRHVLVWCAL